MQWIVLRGQTVDQTFSAQMYPYNAYLFEYKPILITPAQSFMYSLSFKEITSPIQYETPAYTYTAALVVIPSSSSTGVMDLTSTGMDSSTGAFNMVRQYITSFPAPSLPLPPTRRVFLSLTTMVVQSWLDERTVVWLGTYEVDGTCKPADDCCCSVGNIIASPYIKSVDGPPQFVFLGSLIILHHPISYDPLDKMRSAAVV
jgi:hypothetical protein